MLKSYQDDCLAAKLISIDPASAVGVQGVHRDYGPGFNCQSRFNSLANVHGIRAPNGKQSDIHSSKSSHFRNEISVSSMINRSTIYGYKVADSIPLVMDFLGGTALLSVVGFYGSNRCPFKRDFFTWLDNSDVFAQFFDTGLWR